MTAAIADVVRRMIAGDVRVVGATGGALILVSSGRDALVNTSSDSSSGCGREGCSSSNAGGSADDDAPRISPSAAGAPCAPTSEKSVSAGSASNVSAGAGWFHVPSTCGSTCTSSSEKSSATPGLVGSRAGTLGCVAGAGHSIGGGATVVPPASPGSWSASNVASQSSSSDTRSSSPKHGLPPGGGLVVMRASP